MEKYCANSAFDIYFFLKKEYTYDAFSSSVLYVAYLPVYFSIHSSLFDSSVALISAITFNISTAKPDRANSYSSVHCSGM